MQIALVLIDEVHLLNESGRGSSLEAGAVSRIKVVSQFPEMAGVSAVPTLCLVLVVALHDYICCKLHLMQLCLTC